jgi:hypothetical protein
MAARRRENWMREPTIRGLSLYQPWASLMAFGEKCVETRSWRTLYRGLVAIAASANGSGPETRRLNSEPVCAAALKRYDVKSSDLPLGAIVCIGSLSDCVPTETFDFAERRCGPNERIFGDYSPGRYAWVFHGIRMLSRPLPIKGALGLYNLPPDVTLALQEAIAQPWT